MGHIMPLVARAAEGTAFSCFTRESGALSSGSVMVSFINWFHMEPLLWNKACGGSRDTMVKETGINSGHTKLTGTDTP